MRRGNMQDERRPPHPKFSAVERRQGDVPNVHRPRYNGAFPASDPRRLAARIIFHWEGVIMEGRGLTNLLLAIIAGVLLFGKDAMVSGIQGIAIVLVAIFVIYLVLIGIRVLIGSIAQSYRDAKDAKEALLITFSLAAAAVLVPLCAYAGWLWLAGADRPLDAAVESWLGKAWMAVLVAGLAGVALYAARNALAWLRANWRNLPDYLRLGARYLGILAVAPFLFPTREWRFKRAEGSGVIVSFFSSIYAGLTGLVLWMSLLVATIFAVLGVLFALGVVD